MNKSAKEPKKRKTTTKSSGPSREPKQKKSDPSSSRSIVPKPSKFQLCNLFGDDEDAAVIAEAKNNALKSVLWRRVANGLLKRSEDLEGNLFVELRVYNKADIIDVDPRQRYWKAAVNLRYQVDESEPELQALQKFIKLAKTKFTHEGTFCMETNNK